MVSIVSMAFERCSESVGFSFALPPPPFSHLPFFFQRPLFRSFFFRFFQDGQVPQGTREDPPLQLLQSSASFCCQAAREEKRKRGSCRSPMHGGWCFSLDRRRKFSPSPPLAFQRAVCWTFLFDWNSNRWDLCFCLRGLHQARSESERRLAGKLAGT